jgi:hypothetical protein
MCTSTQAFVRRLLLAGMVELVSCPLLLSQNPQLKTKNGQRFPTVIFTSVFWAADPSYYSIAIDSTGAATYQSAPRSLEGTGVPYTTEFQASDKTRRTTFNLAQRLNFLRDTIPVSTGSPDKSTVRTLAYHDLQFKNELTYSSSSDPNVQELTSVLEEISETLELGRRLLYFYDHDKAKLDSELKRIETGGERHRFRELQALAAILNSIVSDRQLDRAVRDRADELLRRARGH